MDLKVHHYNGLGDFSFFFFSGEGRSKTGGEDEGGIKGIMKWADGMPYCVIW